MEAILTSFLGSLPLRNEALTIGRAPRNGLFINNATVSRRHAEIHPTAQGYYCIVDLESTSGTFVNGVRLNALTPYLLRAGDAIQVGDFSLLYEEREMSAESDELTTPPVTGAGQSLSGMPASGVDHRSAHGDVLVVSDLQPLSPVSGEQFSATPLPASYPPAKMPTTSSTDALPDELAPTTKLAPGRSLPDEQTEPVPAKETGGPAEKASIQPVVENTREQPIDLSQQTLQFTAFYPRTVSVENWQTLLVYAHIDKALEAVRTDARRLREQLEATALPVDGKPEQLVAADALRITVQPGFQGVTFQPERLTFPWRDEIHSAAFRFSADARWTGAVGTGEVLLLAGPLIIASLRIPLRFTAPDAVPEPEQEEVSVARYTRIFTSYSHEDTGIIRALRRVYKILGDDSFHDIEKLRAGENWHHALQRAIEGADVFQLFWSSNLAQSSYVYQECQYAFQHYKYEGFIRPIYWQKPLGSLPPELSHLYFTYYPLPEAR